MTERKVIYLISKYEFIWKFEFNFCEYLSLKCHEVNNGDRLTVIWLEALVFIVNENFPFDREWDYLTAFHQNRFTLCRIG